MHTTQPPPLAEPNGTRRCLVVFFSGDEPTELLALELARRCRAERERIREARPRDGLAGRLRTAWHSVTRAAPPIAPPRRRPADYDLVVIGTPVWRGGPAAPVRSYLRRHAGDFKQVAFYCTGAQADPTVFDEMQRLCRRAPIARAALRADRRSGSLAGESLRRFVAALQS